MSKNLKLSENDKKRLKHLVIDLDHTILHTKTFARTFRPGLRDFFESSFEKFETVSIWTAACKRYMSECVKGMREYEYLDDDMEFYLMWDGDKCTWESSYVGNEGTRHSNYITKEYKDLGKMFKHTENKLNSSNTIMLDDTAEVGEKNPDNLLVIPRFYAKNKKTDRCLEVASEWFEKVIKCEMDFVDEKKNIKWSC